MIEPRDALLHLCAAKLTERGGLEAVLQQRALAEWMRGGGRKRSKSLIRHAFALLVVWIHCSLRRVCGGAQIAPAVPKAMAERRTAGVLFTHHSTRRGIVIRPLAGDEQFGSLRAGAAVLGSVDSSKGGRGAVGGGHVPRYLAGPCDP